MSKNKTKTPTSRPLQRFVGQSYVFMREGHNWHSCEVSVLAIKGGKLIVARCSDVCDALLSKMGSAKRKNLERWTCTTAELW